MTTNDTSLWAAFGSPNRLDVAPRARCPTWVAARKVLTKALRSLGCFARVRSWHGIWTLLHSSALPSSCTWNDLCTTHTLHDLRLALDNRGSSNPLAITFWNVRWLVSPHTDAAIGKRGAICRQILRGAITALVETHWTQADEDLWASAFPTSRIVSAPAWGERRGGVALIVPQR